jgi:FtsP/CotA-like multicopper oxidase with cupredoxin domain
MNLSRKTRYPNFVFLDTQFSYRYRFRADRFGFSWYHSHYSAQYAGGLLGPIIVHGPSHARYDVDLGPVFITDWYHQEYYDIIKGIMGTDRAHWDLFSQSNLINGRGQFNCSKVTDGTPCDSTKAGNAQFSFKSGQTHLLRLINAGAEGFEYFSIDGHQMTVISNDFVPIQPYNTTVVTLGVGQRAEVLVRGVGKPESSYWMRANNSYICGQTEVGEAVGEIRYEKADLGKKPTSEAQPFVDPGSCTDNPLDKTVPFYPVKGVIKPDTVIVYNINKTINATGQQEWTVNDSAFRGNYNNPLMLLAQQGNFSYPEDPEWNVYDFKKNKTVRMILNNLLPFSSRLSHVSQFPQVANIFLCNRSMEV